MSTLLREPVPVPPVDLPALNGAPAGPPEGAAAPEAQERRCDLCGAPMAHNQDWCLECGVAAGGRLGDRPGLRAALTVAFVTLLLAGGAVAASYAALSGDANREAALPAPPSATPVAQAQPAAPPATPPPAAVVPPAGQVTPPTGVPGATATPTPGIPRLPVVPVPPRVNPVPPAAVTPPATPPAPAAKPSPPAKPAAPQRIALGADAVSLYDPYGSATEKGDPADAYDKDLKSSWFVTSKNATSMSVGLVVDLEKVRSVKSLELATSTPGYRVEIYATDSSELPPDVLDARWTHARDRSRVDETSRDGTKAGDGAERIPLGEGAGKYRYVMLWFTTPPDAGPTVRISELALVG